MKNRTREICTSGSVRDEDGNILIYSANDREDRGNVGIIRSPLRASILPDFHYRTFRRSVVLIAIKLAVRSRLKRRLTKIVTLWGLDDYLPKQA